MAVKNWMCANLLKENEGKTEVIFLVQGSDLKLPISQNYSRRYGN